MGTDIHAVAQARSGSEPWEDVPIPGWDQGRHYYLFGWLADVRNGVGFAGCKTGEAIRPIAFPRGLPPDFDVDDGMHPTSWDAVKDRFRRDYRYAKDGERLEEPEKIQPGDPDEFYTTREEFENPEYDEETPSAIWMGDHSYSWLNAQEILDPERRPAQRTIHGIVSRDEYVIWKHTGSENPRGWCGGVSGHDVNIVDEPEGGFDVGEWSRNPIPANATHIRCSWQPEDDGLQHFIDCVQKLVDDNPGKKVRIVFGFDS